MNERRLNDQELAAAIRTWMDDEPAGQSDRSRVVGNVVRQLGATRRRRRWRFSLVRQEAMTATARRRRADDSDPVPAIDGHSPTTIGRTHFMLSPVKTIVAATLVFGVGGVFLVAQPFAQQAGVPGAEAYDPAMAPSFFSGSFVAFDRTAEPMQERREDGVVEYSGESLTFEWDTNDPRIAGTATMVLNETDYREGATTLAPTGDVGTIRTGLIRIVNQGGTWEGQIQNLLLEDPNSERDSSAGWLTGTGDYEGLSAYVVFFVGGDGTLRGHITAEGPPPVPEDLPA